MTLIRKLASALCLALLFSNYSNAQVDSTTGNLINYGTTSTDTTSTWNNGVYVNTLCFYAGNPGNCGPNPSVRSGGVINFSYGTTDLNQIVNINRALAAGGTGVQLSGFNFGFMAKNGNGWDDGRQDYLAAYVKFYNAGGGLAANYDYSSQTNRKYDWTNFQFSETFATPLSASNYSNAQVGFVGRDNNFWAGNYGPEIYNVSFSLKYRVDPCALNPAYSPNCSGFNNIITSNNILPSPDIWGTSLNQIVAINTALKNGGIGATIHGFNYGFDYTVGQSWSGCTATNQDGSCSWYMNIPAQVSATAQLTNSNNQLLYSRNYSLTGDGTSGSVSGQYLLSSSLNQTYLGDVRLSGSASGTGSSIGNFSASLIYTADPCIVNPLYSTQCSGYGAAYAKSLTSTSSSTLSAYTGTSSVTPSSQVETSPIGVIDQTSPQTTSTSSSTSTASTSTSTTQDTTQTATVVATADPAQPASTTPTPAGGPAQTTSTSSSSSSSSSSSGGPSKLAMSVLKANQEKDKATQNAAVQSAAKTLEGSMQSSQASSNAAITMNQDMSSNSATAAATFASQQTQTSIQASMQASQSQQSANLQSQQTSRVGQQFQQSQQDSQQTQVQAYTGTMQSQQSMYTPPQQQTQDTQSTQVAMLKPPTQIVEIQQQSSSGTGLTISRNAFAYNPLMSFSSANTSLTSQQPLQMYQPKLDTRQFEVETPQMPVASFSGSRAGNPLSEIIMQQRFEMMQSNITPSISSVNKNVQSNELAGGVDIASMATTPAGFNAYSFVLKDAAFYEPKEVYKNQRTVDNERVLRGLTRGSDSLHQQMVDSQYKTGN